MRIKEKIGELELPDHEEFLIIVKKLQETYREKIRSQKYYVATKLHRISYFPEL